MKITSTAQPRPVVLTVELTGQDIIDMLRRNGHNIASDSKVYFPVPSGGDYSGMRVDIDEYNPIIVRG